FGKPGPDTVLRDVEKTRIQKDGSPGPWTAERPMSTPRIFTAATAHEDIIYVAGGEYFPEGRMLLLNTVEWTRVDKNGNLGPWQTGSIMQTPRRWPTISVVDGYLYAMGGYNGTFLKSVERARILQDGSLGPWEYLPGQLTTERYIHGGAAVGNRIYVIGGHLQSGGDGIGGAEWTTVGEDGNLTEWRPTSSMLQPRFLAGSATGGNSIFVIGGYNGGYLDSVEWTAIETDGNLGDWTASTPLPAPREGPATVILNKRIYIMGGSNQGNYLTSTAWTEIGADGALGTWETGKTQH
ncbi:MAG TPA: hypothetical protein VIU33_06460, partial [Nitrospiria bacterium]